MQDLQLHADSIPRIRMTRRHRDALQQEPKIQTGGVFICRVGGTRSA
jgi:hypothetical protein